MALAGHDVEPIVQNGATAEIRHMHLFSQKAASILQSYNGDREVVLRRPKTNGQLVFGLFPQATQ
jgi:hypothetical protein